MSFLRKISAFMFTGAASRLLYFAGWKRKTVEANLRHVDFFAESSADFKANVRISPEECFSEKARLFYRALLKNLCRHVGELLFCFGTYKRLPADVAEYPCKVDGWDFDLAEGSAAVVEKMRKGGIFLTAHYGNYEASGAWLCALGVPLKASFIPLKPKWLNNFVYKKVRCVRGRPYSIDAQTPREFLRLLDKGEGRELFCLLADQDSRIPSALEGTFLGRKVSNNPLPDFLLKHRPQTPVFFCWIDEVYAEKGGWPVRRVLHAEEVTAVVTGNVAATATETAALTATGNAPAEGGRGASIVDSKYNSWLEKRIYENPALWYGFTHRRFYSQEKNIY